jgi:16S rRNA (guanine527-N7)-methyltransferase
MSGEDSNVGDRLNALLAAAGIPSFDSSLTRRFEQYLALLMRWNARTNLTSIRDVEGVLARHFLESIACAQALPEGIVTLLDYGSGAGFPGIPIALCRPEIMVTLAESQGKKAAFLQEAVRVLGLSTTVHGGRAETLTSKFDCVALRAVDRMQEAIESAAKLVRTHGWLVLIATGRELASHHAAAGKLFAWQPPITLPYSLDRVIALGKRGGTDGHDARMGTVA